MSIRAVDADTPSGTPVLLVKDDRSVVETVTRSKPWEIDSGDLLVKVNGIAGGYLATRCYVQARTCPLPRIGSKEWGWGVKYKPPFNEPVWHSPCTRIFVERYEEREGVSEFNHRGCYIVIRPGCVGFNSVIYGFKNAICFAELLARRDWRRENRGKRP